MVRESNALGTTVGSYTYGSTLLSRTESGTAAYYHSDGLGSTRLLTDPAGVPTDTYKYAAYGSQLTRSGTSTNTYLFAGEQQDAESGHYYLRARYYDPSLGRFISRDPANGDAATSAIVAQIPVRLWKPGEPYGPHWFIYHPDRNPGCQSHSSPASTVRKYREDQESEREIGAINRNKRQGRWRHYGSHGCVGCVRTNLNRSIKWFGPYFVGGLWNTLRVAEDMFGGRRVNFDIGLTASCITRSGSPAVVSGSKNRIVVGRGVVSNPAYIDLCDESLPDNGNISPKGSGLRCQIFNGRRHGA